MLRTKKRMFSFSASGYFTTDLVRSTLAPVLRPNMHRINSITSLQGDYSTNRLVRQTNKSFLAKQAKNKAKDEKTKFFVIKTEKFAYIYIGQTGKKTAWKGDNLAICLKISVTCYNKLFILTRKTFGGTISLIIF